MEVEGGGDGGGLKLSSSEYEKLVLSLVLSFFLSFFLFVVVVCIALTILSVSSSFFFFFFFFWCSFWLYPHHSAFSLFVMCFYSSPG